MVSSETAWTRSCTGRLCQYRYSSAFISSNLVYLRMVLSMRSFVSCPALHLGSGGAWRRWGLGSALPGCIKTYPWCSRTPALRAPGSLILLSTACRGLRHRGPRLLRCARPRPKGPRSRARRPWYGYRYRHRCRRNVVGPAEPQWAYAYSARDGCRSRPPYPPLP